MKILEFEFNNTAFLAPLAGVTDTAFRSICREMGCGLVYTEMISAKGLYYNNENTCNMLQFSEVEKPAAVQLFGREPEIMGAAAEMFNHNKDICLIDINMGCPAPKIVKNGEGSALMKDPELASKIVSSIKKYSNKPITVKFRKGFDENNINGVEFAKIMEASGADAITIHGRTRSQMYEGKADWDIIKKIKRSVQIPVIGNGDIFSAGDAAEMLNATGCDGVMIGRGSMGNPWIFNQIRQMNLGHMVIYPDAVEKIETILKHYNRAIAFLGENRAVREMRKHIAWYVKGLRNCTDIKNRINYETSSAKVFDILIEYKNSFENNIVT
jgi:tRNA-dihydrouridine synthase B